MTDDNQTPRDKKKKKKSKSKKTAVVEEKVEEPVKKIEAIQLTE